MAKKKDRHTVDLTPGREAKLDKLLEWSEGASTADVFRDGMDLLHGLVGPYRDGAKVIIRDRDGKESEMVAVLLKYKDHAPENK